MQAIQAALAHYQQPGGFDLHLSEIFDTQSRFALGVVGILAVSIAVSAIYGLAPGVNVSTTGRAIRFDSFLWMFMPVSGVLIIPLVFGHLAMMHVIQGVFEITRAGYNSQSVGGRLMLVNSKHGVALVRKSFCVLC